MANEELQKTKQNNHKRNTADLVVECLVNEGVEVVFGIPGEENIPLLEAIERNGNIRFVLTRHEQGAGFMAATYAHITGKPGVCLATLGPGALNLTLPVAQANASTTPLVAICAQGNVSRLYKESHQIIDLVSLFQPITQWSSMMLAPSTAPEMVRKAFSIAQRKRPGATCLVIPEDISEMSVPENAKPLPLPRPLHSFPLQILLTKLLKSLAKQKRRLFLQETELHEATLKNSYALLQNSLMFQLQQHLKAKACSQIITLMLLA